MSVIKICAELPAFSVTLQTRKELGSKIPLFGSAVRTALPPYKVLLCKSTNQYHPLAILGSS